MIAFFIPYFITNYVINIDINFVVGYTFLRLNSENDNERGVFQL